MNVKIRYIVKVNGMYVGAYRIKKNEETKDYLNKFIKLEAVELFEDKDKALKIDNGFDATYVGYIMNGIVIAKETKYIEQNKETIIEDFTKGDGIK